MSYAELLWVDHLGMYVRVEVSEQEQVASIVRVPFYRPVLDERDARSVITMASQLAWEEVGGLGGGAGGKALRAIVRAPCGPCGRGGGGWVSRAR